MGLFRVPFCRTMRAGPNFSASCDRVNGGVNTAPRMVRLSFLRMIFCSVALGGRKMGKFGYTSLYSRHSSFLGLFAVRRKDWMYRETVSLIYGACVLGVGGIGLIVAFITELKLNKK